MVQWFSRYSILYSTCHGKITWTVNITHHVTLPLVIIMLKGSICAMFINCNSSFLFCYEYIFQYLRCPLFPYQNFDSEFLRASPPQCQTILAHQRPLPFTQMGPWRMHQKLHGITVHLMPHQSQLVHPWYVQQKNFNLLVLLISWTFMLTHN